jgi:hypothetical protein
VDQKRRDRDSKGRDYYDDDREIDRRGGEHRLHLRTLDDLDGRTAAARMARRLVAELERDLGRDPSTAESELIQRAALLGAILEDAEVRWLERRSVDLAVYGMLLDRQRRCLEALGLQRQPRNISPRHNGATARVIEALRGGADESR